MNEPELTDEEWCEWCEEEQHHSCNLADPDSIPCEEGSCEACDSACGVGL